MFSTGHIAQQCRAFIRRLSVKTAAAENNVSESGETEPKQVVGQKTKKTTSCKMIKRFMGLRGKCRVR